MPANSAPCRPARRRRVAGRKRREAVHEHADGAAGHGADVEARREDAAGVAGGIRHDRRHQLQQRTAAPSSSAPSAVERLIDVLVADAHHLRRGRAAAPPMTTADRRLQRCASTAAAAEQRRAAPSSPLQKTSETTPPTMPERRVGESSAGMHAGDRRHVEERLVAENRALDHDGRDRGDDRRAEQRRVHVADDLLEREEHRRRPAC